jgi:OOP family OmpA-OmpF porin
MTMLDQMQRAGSICRTVRGAVTLLQALAVSVLFVQTASAQEVPEASANFFDQAWRLNASASHLYMQSVKQNKLFETHEFVALEGTIGKNGKARINIYLGSLETGVDLRDVRMRFLLFETFKFPKAEITATLDRTALQGLLKATRLKYLLKFKLSLHGIEKELEALVVVTRVINNAVSVATIKPIIITAADFGLTAGIARLAEAARGIKIAPAASISFDLVFEGSNINPDLEAVASALAKRREQQETAGITVDACRTRFDVISKTRAIYFAVASARLDAKSAPLLSSVARIMKRCTSVRAEIAGHTDSDGADKYNLLLSQKRAQAVAGYLFQNGIAEDRLKTIGYGDTRPVAANDSEPNKAKNRRIEFSVSVASAN